MDTAAVVKALLDLDRLAVAGALASRSMTVGELGELTARDRRTVLAAIGDLRTAGLVDVDGARDAIVPGALREAARSVAEEEMPMDPVIGFGMTEGERSVLTRYFAGRNLVRIPARRSTRLVVLRRLAIEFEPGRRHDEREVDVVLGAFHPDRPALRRALVDEGFLDREPRGGGIEYWRSGGRVTNLPPG